MIRDLAQPSHLLILAVLIAVLFGWKKLPDMTRSVGRSMRIFKSEMGEMKSDGQGSSPSAAASDTVKGTATPPPAATAPPVPAPAAPPVQAPVAPPVTSPIQQDQPVVDPTADPYNAAASHDSAAR